MLNVHLNIKETNQCIDINICLGNNALNGGVYMFLLDDIPLYIGEANIFLNRLSYHLYELLGNTESKLEDLSYFGLKNLTGKHKITYIILEQNLPYNPQKSKNGRLIDANKSLRLKKEKMYIETYYPLTQCPIFVDAKKLIQIRKEHGIRKKDDMLPADVKNKIISSCLNKHQYDYKDIIEIIKTEHIQKNTKDFNHEI